MKKQNKIFILLYFENFRDFMIFSSRNEVTKFFNNEENIVSLEQKGLIGYKIVFGFVQEEFKE